MTNYFLGARFFCPKSLRHKILLTSIRVSGSFLVSFLLLPKISVPAPESKKLLWEAFLFSEDVQENFLLEFFVPGLSASLSPTLSHSLSLSRCVFICLVPLSLSSLSLSLLSPLSLTQESFFFIPTSIFFTWRQKILKDNDRSFKGEQKTKMERKPEVDFDG